MQGGVITQILFDTEIEVEGALLEHHAQLPQGRAGGVAQRTAADANVTLLQIIQPGQQRDQG